MVDESCTLSALICSYQVPSSFDPQPNACNFQVDLYRQHWWRCDGPCQNRPPYYGMVRRAMNRTPSPRDPWWSDHQKSCGGTYHKVREPEDYGKKKQKKGSDTVDVSTSGKDLKGMPKITDLWKKVDGKSSQPNGQDLSTKGKAKINNLWRVENEDSDSSASGKENNTQKVNGTFTPFSGQGHLLGSTKVEDSTCSVSKWKNTGTVRGSTVSGKTSATQSKTGKIGSTFNLNGNKVDPSSKGKEFSTSLSVENIETKTSFKSRVNKIGTSNLRTSNSETISTERHPSLISNRGTESRSNSLHKKDFSSNDTKSKDSTGTQLTIVDAFRNVGNKKAPFIVIDQTPPRSGTSNVLPSLVQCPVCQAKVAETKINAHLDVCL